jgi:hypothetical protein
MADAEGWGDKDTIDIEVVQKLTHKVRYLPRTIVYAELTEVPSSPFSSLAHAGLDWTLTGLSRLPLRTVV